MKLSIDKLCKTYANGVTALRGVTLTIPTGMFGLLGPNGAGKSTLMRTIATLQEADSGTVFLDDLDVLKRKDEVRQILGYLPQEFGLYPKVSARRMINHFAALKGIGPNRQRRAVCDQLLFQTNLYDDRNRRLGSYSGGMKQRFGIALALLGSPKLIIVDEPTAGLDPEERTRFHNLLCEIAQDIIVILSTHIVSDVSDLCQHMGVIHRGRMIALGEPLQLVRKLDGQVWKKAIPRTEFLKCQQDFQVISTRLCAGNSIIHVLSPQQPDPSFDAATTDLQDVYFAAIAQHDKCEASNIARSSR